MTLEVFPMTRDGANEVVERWHRHHGRVVGHRFALGCRDIERDEVIGAAIVGRPVARAFDDGLTAEVVRLVTDGTPNACSKLYGAAWRAWRAMGGRRLVTYTLATEPGTSLRAAGWALVHQTPTRPSGWDCPSRPRASGPQAAKLLWERAA